jgi:hypothetical protein
MKTKTEFKTLFLIVLATTWGFSAKAVTMITSLPCTISVPGNYQLASSLVSAVDAITVNTDNCTIDFDGFVISYAGKGKNACSGIVSKNHANLTVRNGTITGFSTGVTLGGVIGGNNTCALVENLRISQGVIGISLENSSNAVVRGCQIYSMSYPDLVATKGVPSFVSQGISSTGGIGNVITKNQICKILQGCGISLGDNSMDVVDENILSQVLYAIVADSLGAKIKNNTATAVSSTTYSGGQQLLGTNF